MAKEKEIAKEAENASRPEAIETKKTEPKAIGTKASRAKAIGTKDGTIKAIEDKRPDKKTPNRGKKQTAGAEQEIFVQYGGTEIVVQDVMDKVKQAYAAEGHRVSNIRTVQLYIKPEENAAYYVINGKAEGKSVSLSD
ncbi:DUF6465 family protein [Cuneatibacter sp. NSJ-177]|uniref:DUF6465 family protein n=1 Tax=Cuneatibacter sp. NSJ-177 TaxID=2931401 RepID=UPI001FD3CDFA|nr:DUF6465 family protein [Cuneatibacter sp. NSJ-177]MCJ7834294.1 DUF6465 family protein [Cuneatibacter sp. NSJ-177]